MTERMEALAELEQQGVRIYEDALQALAAAPTLEPLATASRASPPRSAQTTCRSPTRARTGRGRLRRCLQHVAPSCRLAVGRSGSAIAVSYGVYRGNDPFCCPSSRKVVLYSWTGGRIVASARPPLIYGQRGARMHVSG